MKVPAPGGSLHQRTALVAVLATGIAVTLTGAIVWLLMRTMALDTLDHHLEERLAQLRSLVRVRGGTVHFPPGTLTPGRGEYVVLRDGAGTVLADLDGGLGPYRLRTCTWTDQPFVPPGRPEAAEGPPLDLSLEVGHATGTITADLNRLALVLLGAGLAATLGTVLLVHWLSRAVLRPVTELAAAIAAIDPRTGDGRDPLEDVTVPRELAAVPARIRDLLARVQAALRRERQTAATIAHELRTPVAGLRATLEFALARPRTATADAEDLAACRALVTALEDTISRLLLLSRLERGLVVPAPVSQPLAPLLTETADALSLLAADRSMTLEVRVSPDLVGAFDRTLVAIILRSLVANALQHGRRGTNVILDAHAGASGFILGCRNQVLDIPAAQAAARDASGGTGIGLPLVRRLVEVQQASLDLQVHDGVFSTEIRFSEPTDGGGA